MTILFLIGVIVLLVAMGGLFLRRPQPLSHSAHLGDMTDQWQEIKEAFKTESCAFHIGRKEYGLRGMEN